MTLEQISIVNVNCDTWNVKLYRKKYIYKIKPI